MNDPLEFEKSLSKERIEIYPNPSVGFINISSDKELNAQLEIYNTAGKLVKSINANSSNNQDISIADLENGIYMMRIIDNETKQVNTKKIILSKD